MADHITSSNEKDVSTNTAAKQLDGYPASSSDSYDDQFNDRTISVKDWSARTFGSPGTQLRDYVVNLFPIATWIYRYNFTWFIGDVCGLPGARVASSF